MAFDRPSWSVAGLFCWFIKAHEQVEMRGGRQGATPVRRGGFGAASAPGGSLKGAMGMRS